MEIDLKRYKKNILFLPLGGSGEIGLNCNLYHYNGKWIIIDIGIGFVNDIPGVDVVVPDITFIKKHKKDFLAIILTHIHDDHIGAIQYLWEELELPIYATKFTALFLKERLFEYDFYDRVKIIEINENETLKLKPFELEFINLTHSTLEMVGILIKTEKGNIFHTGDWKFELKPILGSISNKKRLKELGNKNKILAVTCESTNVFKNEKCKTETDLLLSLKEIIKKNNKGLIVCSLFASNISRIISIALAGKSAKRKIGVIGRSIYRILKVAKEMNYIPKGVEFVLEEDFKKYNKKELLIISTGCQGEKTSSLSKLASGTYKYISLSENDTVIFSSSVIPGNEKNIYKIYNKLSEKDVKIITNENHFVHLSGHYTKPDLIEMYKLIKPKIVIATHGEEMHLSEHKRIANDIGIKNVIKAKNGNLIKIDTDNFYKNEVLTQIKITNSAIDGKRIVPINSNIINERQKIADAGIIFIILFIDKNYKLIKSPSITTVGNYNLFQEKNIKEIFEKDIIKSYNEAIYTIINDNNIEKYNTDEKKQLFLNKEIHKTVNKIFQSNMGKKAFFIIKICIV